MPNLPAVAPAQVAFEGARVGVARAIRSAGARALVEAVGGDKAARGSACHHCLGLVGDSGEVAGAILGLQLVVVGARGQAAVAVGKARRLGDPVCDRGGKAGGGRAVEVVAADPDVVGCRSPGERGLSRCAGCAQGRARGRGRIGDHCLGLVRESREVAGCILGSQLVVVAPGCQPEVGVERRHRLGDPVGKRGGKARARAPVEVVARDSHVVARCRPGDVDVGADNRRCNPGGCSRGSRCRQHLPGLRSRRQRDSRQRPRPAPCSSKCRSQAPSRYSSSPPAGRSGCRPWA